MVEERVWNDGHSKGIKTEDNMLALDSKVKSHS